MQLHIGSPVLRIPRTATSYSQRRSVRQPSVKWDPGPRIAGRVSPRLNSMSPASPSPDSAAAPAGFEVGASTTSPTVQTRTSPPSPGSGLISRGRDRGDLHQRAVAVLGAAAVHQDGAAAARRLAARCGRWRWCSSSRRRWPVTAMRTPDVLNRVDSAARILAAAVDRAAAAAVSIASGWASR